MRRVTLYRQFESLTKSFLSFGRKTYGDAPPSEFTPFPFHRLLISFQSEPIYSDTVGKLNKIKAVKGHLEKLVGTAGGKGRVDENSIIRTFLSAMMKNQNTWRFNKAKAIKVYNELEDFFFTKTIWHLLQSPLFGFRMNRNRHAFTSNVIIRKTTDNEKTYFNNHFHSPRYVDHVVEYKGPFIKIIENDKRYETESNIPMKLGDKIVSSLCSALRFVHSGFVAYGGIWDRPLFLSPTAMGTSISGLNYPIQWWAKYDYSASQHPTALNYYHLLMDFDYNKHRAFGIALRRFNFAYDKMRNEDRLIDYVIALEALLLYRIRDELKYRLALRTAHLIGQSDKQRKYYFDLMKAAYDQRSAIIHGEHMKSHININGRQVPYPRLVNETEEALRKVLVYFLTNLNKRSHEKIIDQIDRKCL